VAAQARAITIFQRVRSMLRKKSTFSRAGFFAEHVGRQKNSSRAYADIKNPFEARIAFHQCAIHRLGGRQKFERFHAEKLGAQNR